MKVMAEKERKISRAKAARFLAKLDLNIVSETPLQNGLLFAQGEYFLS